MATDAERIKKIGDLGEHFFRGLCIGANVSQSRPGRDEKGWDFFIEMPQNRLPSVYLDAQPAPIKLLCQVKSTDDFSDRKLSMKVSNFEHLARTPIPSFVLVVDFRNTDSPQAVYLLHFNAERIAQTLTRIRELEAAGKRISTTIR